MNRARRRLTPVIEQISMSERRIPYTPYSSRHGYPCKGRRVCPGRLLTGRLNPARHGYPCITFALAERLVLAVDRAWIHMILSGLSRMLDCPVWGGDHNQ